MSDPGNAIGDMTAINDHEFLVIERDNNQGVAAAFTRIYKIDLRTAGADGTVAKEFLVDLMAITDHDGLTQTTDGAVGLGSIFTFPSVTIEDVYPVDSQKLLVINDITTRSARDGGRGKHPMTMNLSCCTCRRA